MRNKEMKEKKLITRSNQIGIKGEIKLWLMLEKLKNMIIIQTS